MGERLGQSFTVDEALLTKLNAEGLTVEEYYILFSKGFKNKWTSKVKPSVFTYNGLIVKGLLTSNRKISAKGIVKLTEIQDGGQDLVAIEPNRVQTISEEANWVWLAYPTTDKVLSFPKTRALRTNRGECLIEIQKILDLKTYTSDDLISAIKNEVASRTKQSITSNNLTYMKNMLRWLRNEDYLAWIGDIKTQEGDTSVVTGGLA